jgi:hypothetical protein
MVNQMKAGVAVTAWEDLKRADLVVVAVPEGDLGRWVREIAECGVDWIGTSFVVCGRAVESGALGALRDFGASVGSLDVMDGFDEKRLLFEGENLALHRVRRMVEEDGRAKVVELEFGKKRVYEAGMTFASGMIFPMIAAAVDAFKVAGMRGNVAEGVVEMAVAQTVRAYLRAGKRGWTGPVAKGDREELGKQYRALFDAEPVLAEMYLKVAVDYLAEMGAKRGRG